MNLHFYKYQGTGNDFVMIDNRSDFFPKENVALINKLCDRRFGIGGDGLILLENSETSDFKMVYFNADGNESTMCGNGGRCLVAFAKKLNIFDKETTFDAIDGLHYASIENDIVSLQMIDVDSVEIHDTHCFLDTGSPHHVQLVSDIDKFPVFNKGKEIRNGAPYFEEGSNVNFVEKTGEASFKVRTYERGVEDETLACGTGVTAVAIAMHRTEQVKNAETKINTKVLGGDLTVSFNVEQGVYKNVFLEGPAKFVFEGTIEI
ncbi:diaminopimelate epimerase [Aureivirga sp. CE67]|uniref:diaminopimelate epimerase n=1 Tax=Aureivirga sp. CE67 TaxID=1788983 RepID=UPI0018CB9F3C|nr:diaminopimelate epimerase [Aureivirga sp. CE67]